jgi:hypothetical protein
MERDVTLECPQGTVEEADGTVRVVTGAAMGYLAGPTDETVPLRCVRSAERGALHRRGNPVEPEYAGAALSGTFPRKIAQDPGGFGDTAGGRR